MKAITLVLAFIVLGMVATAQVIEHSYDFNDLDLGNLDGQDGWTTVVNSGGSPNEMDVAYEYQGVVSYDGTKAVMYGQSGGNYGRTGSRASEENFPFDFTLGGTVEVELDINTGWWGTLFGFGYDVNNNGYLMPAIETIVNIEPNEGGFGIHIANQSYPQMIFFMPDGSKVNFSFPFGSSSGWFRYKFFLDLDANGGAGSVTLFVREMEGDFVPVPEISDLNLGLTPGTGTSEDPATWSKIFLHATGGTSGFDNMVLRMPDTGGLLYQYITFNPLPDRLTTAAPFTVTATTNQNLPVQFSVTSGPATIQGSVVTLTGEPGIVTIKASQPGNATVAPAEDVSQSFEVVDPLSVIPEMEIRNPVQDGTVRMPGLSAMSFVVSTEIEHPDLLHIESVTLEVDGTNINGFETSNGFFLVNWFPPALGSYTATVTAVSSGGPAVSGTVSFDVVADAPTMDVVLIEDYHFTAESLLDTVVALPSFSGTYSQVIAVLDYGCPCDPWDRVARVTIRGANGEWIELFKYITPYGVPCSDQIDITDFVSQLQGRVEMKMSFPESVTSLTLHYEAGTPDYVYSWVDNLWQGTYPFGDYANLQPVEVRTLNFSPDIEEAYLRLHCGGFSWGETNTGNAAEFYDATHNIKLNDEVEFQQHLWQTCNPNPAGCSPQNGTWFYNRHGWCPGSIAMLFRYDLSPWLSTPDVELMYEFYPGYVDLCHPNHPDCVTGVTCSNCFDTWNPEIDVAGVLVTYSNDLILTSLKESIPYQHLNLSIEPNPSRGIFDLSVSRYRSFEQAEVKIMTMKGLLVKEFQWDGTPMRIDLGGHPKGVYLLTVRTSDGLKTEKIVIQ
jgi:hypothetical protein